MDAQGARAGATTGLAPTGIRIGLTAKEAHIRAALATLRRALAGRGLGPTDCDTTELVLAEALNNIAEHAYGGQHPGPVRLSLRLGRGGITASLRDRGRPMSGSRMPEPGPPAIGVRREAIPEGGFGWFLIRDLTTARRYRRVRGENRLTLCIPRTGS